MNKNNLFKAVQAAYNSTLSEPITGVISKDDFIKSIKNDIFENAFVILLSDNAYAIDKYVEPNLRFAPSINCSARMIVEDLAILKGIELGIINEEQIAIAALTQRYRFNIIQTQFAKSDFAIPEKDKALEFLKEDKKSILNVFDSLKVTKHADLFNYQCFLDRPFNALVRDALGETFVEYRNIFSFLMHFGLLNEEVDSKVLEKASKAIDVLLETVENIILTDYPDINTAKYKSFKSHIEKMDKECKEFRLIEFPWYYLQESFTVHAIDRYNIKRQKASCLDFKLCLMFNLKMSLCKRSKTFLECFSIEEYVLGFKKEARTKLEELAEVSSCLRLSKIISDQNFVEGLNTEKKCVDAYNKYFKDNEKVSYTAMVDQLASGSVTFLDVENHELKIIDSVYTFIEANARSKIDIMLCSFLFKGGNKTDHFTGGYPNYNNNVINYWANATYLYSLLNGYAPIAKWYLQNTPEKSLHGKFVNDISDEVMRYGGDEFFGLDSRHEHRLLQDKTAGFVPQDQPKLNVLDFQKLTELIDNNKK